MDTVAQDHIRQAPVRLETEVVHGRYTDDDWLADVADVIEAGQFEWAERLLTSGCARRLSAEKPERLIALRRAQTEAVAREGVLRKGCGIDPDHPMTEYLATARKHQARAQVARECWDTYLVESEGRYPSSKEYPTAIQLDRRLS